MSDLEHLASRLREAVTIQSRSLTGDGLGGNTESWSAYANLFAEVTPISGAMREQVIGEQREGRAAYRIVLRQSDGITTAMRIQWRGRTLHIHGVLHSRAITEIIAYEGGEA